MPCLLRHNSLPVRRLVKGAVNTTRRIALLVLLAVASLAGLQQQAHARVFQRIGRFSASEILKTAGGTLAYQADVTINGGRGHLTVAGFPSGMDEVTRQLRKLFNTTELPVAGSGLIQATLRQGRNVTRLMVFRLEDSARTLAIAVEQSEAEYAESMVPPRRHLQHNMPAFPSSTPRFFVRDDEALVSLAVADTQAPGEAASYFSSELARLGWQSAMPDGSDSNLQVFMRGPEVCCLYLAPGASQGEGNIIAVLHKQQRVK